MRKVTKTTSAKFIKILRENLLSVGAIPIETKYDGANGASFYEGKNAGLGFLLAQNDNNEFIMETTNGLLWIGIRADVGSSLFAIHTRFDEADKAKVNPVTSGCNHYSGKWNHYFYDGTDAGIVWFINQLTKLIPKNRKVITNYDRLDEVASGDYKKVILVIDGQLFTNTRLAIDSGTSWEGAGLIKKYQGKNKKVILVDGVQCVVSKSIPFQLILES